MLRQARSGTQCLQFLTRLSGARAEFTRLHREARPRSPWATKSYSAASRLQSSVSAASELHKVIESFNDTLQLPTATLEIEDLANITQLPQDPVILHGYLGTQRNASSKLTFLELVSIDGTHTVQLKSLASDQESTAIRDELRSARPFTPVAVTGLVEPRSSPPKSPSSSANDPIRVTNVEVSLSKVRVLNEFPKDIMVAAGTVIPPEQRHLQFRTNKDLRDSLMLRSRVYQSVRSFLCSKHSFTEIETPLLFKSTPEGAHEFLVPTRSPGLAYALPQSPQQYKQILMASGIPRYMQIAKCFRDEDLRADRQPEFTQIDIEMAFADETQVMKMIENLVKQMWEDLLQIDLWQTEFPRLTYEEAMSTYGSDKPDTRFDARLSRIDYMIPVDLTSKISDLKDPVVEVMKLTLSGDPRETRDFVSSFMDSPEARPFMENPDGQPGIFIYDPRKPLGGLQPFGFEAAEVLEEKLELDAGDLMVVQARPRKPFSGGSTMLGNLRLALHRSAVAAELVDPPTGWNFLWVTDFPLFTPSTPDTPSNSATPSVPSNPTDLDSTSSTNPTTTTPPLESTHHPFTAPLTPTDTALLLTDPLAAKAAHYDLVLNGIELGGGSRRIHHAALQRLVLRDVLKLSETRLADFEHLLRVLRAGCPPHAGMALGLDRLVMLMLGRASVREVMAFPKTGRGEDGLVGAPGRVGRGGWGRYHLRPVGEGS